MTPITVTFGLLFVLFFVSATVSIVLGVAAKEHRTSTFWFRIAVMSALLALLIARGLRTVTTA
jgi:hypothetical protein